MSWMKVPGCLYLQLGFCEGEMVLDEHETDGLDYSVSRDKTLRLRVGSNGSLV